jgi:hypothetical protein
MKRESGLATFALVLLALFFLNTLTAAPAAPRLAKPNFARVKTVSPFELDLIWRDRSNDADGYRIERSTNHTNFRQIAQVLPGTTVYRDKNLFPDTRYFYRIRAFNASGISRYDSISARTETPVVPFSVADWGYPYSLASPTNADLISVSAGAFHTLGLRKDGTVITWSGDNFGAPPVPTNLNSVVAISAGGGFSLALRSDGTVVEWENSLGGARFGSTGGFRPPGVRTPPTNTSPQPPIILPIQPVEIWPILPVEPVQSNLPPVIQPIQLNPQPQSSPRLALPSVFAPPDGLKNVVAISAGLRHALALKSDGTVVAWGVDELGETEVPPDLNGVVEIAAGDAHSLALRSDGTVVGWGGGTSGAGTPPTNLTSLVAIAAGEQLSVAVKSDGTIVAWGTLGFQTATNSVSNATAVALGEYQGTALRSDGSLFNWVVGSPSSIVPDFGPSVMQVSADFNHFAALSTAPAAPSNPSVTVLSATQLRLKWQDNSTDEKSFAIERAIISNNIALPWTQIGTAAANGTRFIDTTVETNFEYSYRVRAIGKFGTSPYCTITCIVAPSIAPAPLSATLNITNEVRLAWRGGPGGIVGYKIERAPDDNGAPGEWQEIGSVNVTNFSFSIFSDSDVTANSTYWYRVRGFNILGFSPYNDPLSVSVVPPLPPDALENETYGNIITLFWFPNANSPPPTGYKVETAPDLNGAPGSWTEVTNIAANLGSYTDIGLTVGASKWYRVRAYNWVGDSPYEDPLRVTLPPTPTPYDLTGSLGLTPGINLHWDTASQADGFDVERAPDVNGSPGTWAQIAVVGNLQAFQGSFTDTNVVANTTYWYRVRAFSAVGISDYSTPLQITASLPAPPDEVTLSMADGVQITLSYNSSVPFGFAEVPLLRFSIERAVDAGGGPGAWQEIGAFTNTSPFPRFSFTDTNALPNTIYWYRVRALNWIGYSDYSQPASIGTFPPATPADFEAHADRDSAQLSWNEYLGNFGSYEIERAPDVSGAPGAWALVGTTNSYGQTYVDTNLTVNATYWYRLRAANWAGDSPYTDPLSVTIGPPNAPSDLATQIGLATNTVDLSWVDNSRDADVFTLEYAPDTDGVPGAWIVIATLSVTNEQYLAFADTNVTGYTTNWYRVRAANDLGASDYTTPVRIALLPPPVPFDFVGNSSGPNEIDLFWLDLNDLVQGYRLERAPDVAHAPGSWSEIFNGGAGQNIFLPDGTVAASATYWYRVRAYNWVGDSAFTDAISISTPAIVNAASIATTTAPQILSLTQTNGGMLIQWSTTAGNTDVVQASESFASGYTNLSPALIIKGSGTVITNYFDASALTNSPARFYRIQSSR